MFKKLVCVLWEIKASRGPGQTWDATAAICSPLITDGRKQAQLQSAISRRPGSLPTCFFWKSSKPNTTRVHHCFLGVKLATCADTYWCNRSF